MQKHWFTQRGVMTIKRLMLVYIMILCMILLSSCTVISRDTNTSFNLETDGLVQVQTVHESDKTVKNYVLASELRIMDAEPFASDNMQIFTVSSFSTGMNNMLEGPLKAYDEAGRNVPVTREIDTICHAMQDIGHHVMECRILQVGDEWFVSAMLNVNLWTPYQFYYFNQESGRLMLLYEFNGRNVTAVRILSAEKLHTLDQRSIGGWYDFFTPDRLMEEQPNVLEDAAKMFLQRNDLFDEACTRFHSQVRCLAADSFADLSYSSLLHGVTYVHGTGQESITYLNDDEKTVFQALLDLCPPYEIEQIPGTSETCTVLIFRFAAFNQETNCQEEWTLFRLADAPESSAFEHTVLQLQEQYGELIICEVPGWLMLKH